MLHYSSKDFFSPVIISPQVTTSKDLNVYVVSDLLYDLKELTAELRVHSWDNKTLKVFKMKNIRMVNSKLQYTYDLCLHSGQAIFFRPLTKQNLFIQLGWKVSYKMRGVEAFLKH